MRVSKSLRMQKDTGIPHCVCCLKPTADKGLRFLPSANVRDHRWTPENEQSTTKGTT
jgi:hypothetical protein